MFVWNLRIIICGIQFHAETHIVYLLQSEGKGFYLKRKTQERKTKIPLGADKQSNYGYT